MNQNADSRRFQPADAKISPKLTNDAGLHTSDASVMNPAISARSARLMAAAIQDGSTLHGHVTRSHTEEQWMLRCRNADGWRVIVRTASFERYHGHVAYWLELREMQRSEAKKGRRRAA
jgi:hypothetical protein